MLSCKKRVAAGRLREKHKEDEIWSIMYPSRDFLIRCSNSDVYKRQHQGIVDADFLDETAVAGIAGIGHNDAVERSLLGAHSSQSDLNHDCTSMFL